MRLINTKTGLIEDFIGDDIPEYAILSHTWEKDEISLQEYQRFTDPDFANDPKTAVGRAKAGFIKIKSCVELAASQGIPYVWVDTCCIDKTSSADLTESINSMYRWYAKSNVCFAYLVDVKLDHDHHEFMDIRLGLQNCRWLNRGWTLQELVAPSDVKFYSNSWDHLGDRGFWAEILSDLTGIPIEVLETNDLSSASVAQKMPWASHRKTTRKEDMAYCLLGLFDINMPLLYGEGDMAFLRLQEHIAASSTDHSLFAWGVCNRSPGENWENIRSYRSIFARSPADFAECGDLMEFKWLPPESWTQTNRGLHAIFPTFSFAVAKKLFDGRDFISFPEYIEETDYLVVLNCCSDGRSPGSLVNQVAGIWISLIDARDDGKHGFCRVTDTTILRHHHQVYKLLRASPDNFLKDMWLATTPRTLQIPHDYFSKRLGGFLIPTPKTSGYGVFGYHSLYGSQVINKGYIMSCPFLPLETNAGFVGAVSAKFRTPRGGRIQAVHALVVFGFPPRLRGPVGKIFAEDVDESDIDSHRELDFDKDPLQYGLQRFVELEKGDYDNKTVIYSSNLITIRVMFRGVIEMGMIFTQAEIYSGSW